MDDLGFDHLVHSFAETFGALDETLREHLEDGSEMPTGWRKHLRSAREQKSLYALFLDRNRRGDLPCEEVANLLELTIREFVFLQNELQNLSSTVSSGSDLSIGRRTIAVTPILTELGELFFAKAGQKGIELKIQVRDDVRVFADAGLFRRALINVLDNAVKYSYSATDETTRFIEVEARRHSAGGDLLVAVTSYGVGILESEISSGAIFRRGFRGSLASDRERSGTGLGLSETKSIVERHGGTLRVDSLRQNSDAFLTSVVMIFPSH